MSTPRTDAALEGRIDALDERIKSLQTRVGQLQATVESLQDAVYRQSVMEDERIEELRKRTRPEELARALSQDARRRGI